MTPQIRWGAMRSGSRLIIESFLVFFEAMFEYGVALAFFASSLGCIIFLGGFILSYTYSSSSSFWYTY
jgi:hypothetical protein